MIARKAPGEAETERLKKVLKLEERTKTKHIPILATFLEIYMSCRFALNSYSFIQYFAGRLIGNGLPCFAEMPGRHIKLRGITFD